MEKQKEISKPRIMSTKKIIAIAVLISIGVAIALSGSLFAVNWLMLNDQDLNLQRKINTNQTKINQLQKDLSDLKTTVGASKEAELLNAVKEEITTPTEESTTETVTDPTANWKNYTDDKYKYDVKLPSDWYSFTNDNGFDFIKQYSTENVQSPIELSTEKGVWLTIKVEDSRGSSLETWANRTPYSPIGSTVESRKDAFISNFKAIDQIENGQSSFGAKGGYSRVLYLINTNTNQLYTLTFVVITDKSLLTSQAIDLIVQNFKLN